MKICNLLSIAVVFASLSVNQAASKDELGAALAEAINNSQQMSDLVGCVFKSTREAIKSSGSFDKELIIRNSMKYCKPYNQVFITVAGDAGFISLLVKIIDIGESEFHKSGLSAYSEYDHIPYINEKTLNLYLNNKSSLNSRPLGK